MCYNVRGVSDMQGGFVYLDEAAPGIRWDAKYAGPDNFTGAPVDGYFANRVVCARELAEALRAVRSRAEPLGLGLLVWDSYRPQRAVDRFLAWASEPEDGRTKEKHYPRIARGQMVSEGYIAARSAHSRGAAVDLTLCELPSGRPLDMGGGFDLMDARSHHGAEGVPERAAENRRLLREIMERSGFEAYEREWWHYRLREEPHPDTHFDFPVA